jgi:hypothetical protein
MTSFCCLTVLVVKHESKFVAEHNWLTAVQYFSFLILYLTFYAALLNGKKDQITFKFRLQYSIM